MGVRPAKKKKRCHLPEGSYWLFFFFSTGKWMTIFPTFASCRTLYRSGQWEGGRGSSPSFPSFYRQSASRGIDLCTTIYYTERERETSVSAAARETCSFPSPVTPPTNRPHLLFRGGCYFPSFPLDGRLSLRSIYEPARELRLLLPFPLESLVFYTRTRHCDEVWSIITSSFSPPAFFFTPLVFRVNHHPVCHLINIEPNLFFRFLIEMSESSKNPSQN